ncbi:MAG TPA: hypothetical protein VH877_18705, partial [Polyangia bacterium]|nr:hypothetical protein [Polyangia bacterium]
NSPLSIDPTDPRIEQLIRYDANGSIVCDDPGKQRDLDKVLNLNLPFLCRNRKAVLTSFIESETRRSHGTWSDDALAQRLQELQTPVDGQLPEYLGVIIAWIRKRQGRRR